MALVCDFLADASLTFRAVNVRLMWKKEPGKNLAIDQNRGLAMRGATFLQHSRPTSVSTLAGAGIDPAISLSGYRASSLIQGWDKRIKQVNS